jgi:hypothetical protein
MGTILVALIIYTYLTIFCHLDILIVSRFFNLALFSIGRRFYGRLTSFLLFLSGTEGSEGVSLASSNTRDVDVNRRRWIQHLEAS